MAKGVLGDNLPANLYFHDDHMPRLEEYCEKNKMLLIVWGLKHDNEWWFSAVPHRVRIQNNERTKWTVSHVFLERDRQHFTGTTSTSEEQREQAFRLLAMCHTANLYTDDDDVSRHRPVVSPATRVETTDIAEQQQRRRLLASFRLPTQRDGFAEGAKNLRMAQENGTSLKVQRRLLDEFERSTKMARDKGTFVDEFQRPTEYLAQVAGFAEGVQILRMACDNGTSLDEQRRLLDEFERSTMARDNGTSLEVQRRLVDEFGSSKMARDNGTSPDEQERILNQFRRIRL